MGLTKCIHSVILPTEVINVSRGNPIVHCRITPDLLERLQALAAERKCDLSTLIKEAIAAYLSLLPNQADEG